MALYELDDAAVNLLRRVNHQHVARSIKHVHGGISKLAPYQVRNRQECGVHRSDEE
jgi:hypothetical protein